MKTGSKIKFLAYLLTVMDPAMLCSCDKQIYDGEGDCVARCRVRFKYDYNMKYADAFAKEVNAVTLYLVNDNEKVVWQKTESGARLAEEGYVMEVNAAPGRYSLLAWCSSENPTTFHTADSDTCRGLKTDFYTDRHDDGTLHIGDKLDRLYHGYVADVEFPDVDEGTFFYTVPLIKDTNHFVITLQQLSGEPIDADDVEFEITDDNAHLDWDNRPVKGSPVTYHQWYKQTVSADLSARASQRSTGSFAGVIAELTTSRLLYDNRADARLRIYRTDTGETIVSIRLIDALLLVMGYDNSKKLTEQQYLDYKDEYPMIFFLDEDHRWIDGLIQIESWRVVYSEQELN